MTNKKVTLFMKDTRNNALSLVGITFNADLDAPGGVTPLQGFNMRFTNVLEKKMDVKWINWNPVILYHEIAGAGNTFLGTYEAQLSDSPVFDQGSIFSRCINGVSIKTSVGNASSIDIRTQPLMMGNGKDTLFSIEKFRGLGAGLRGVGNLYLNVRAFTDFVVGANRFVTVNYTVDVWYV